VRGTTQPSSNRVKPQQSKLNELLVSQLPAGTLIVHDTPGIDLIIVKRKARNLVVTETLRHTTRSVPAAGVSRIRVFLTAGGRQNAAKVLADLPATLVGGAGDDILVGGPSDDVLRGRGGNDTIHGDDGDDTLVGGPGKDLIVDPTGNNLADARRAGADYVIVNGRRKLDRRLDRTLFGVAD
jgi:Ca2+-binding RTX toxin-like protein